MYIKRSIGSQNKQKANVFCFPQIPLSPQLDYYLELDDAGALTLRVLLILIRQTIVNSGYPSPIVNITFSIHGNSFSSFFGFVNQFFNAILPERVNTINSEEIKTFLFIYLSIYFIFVLHQWCQDNSLPVGVFYITDMY